MTFVERHAPESDRQTSSRDAVETLAREVGALRWRLRVLTLVLVSVLAGAFLAGGAWAASQYVITSTAQIKPSVLAKIEKAARPAANASRGDAGPIGATGPAGAPGSAGVPGSAGPPGAIGATGVAGAIGATGVAGAIGATGVAGATGPTGVAGATGATGVAGPDIFAEQLATTAQTAAEQIGTNNSGSYTTVTPAQLASIDPTIRIYPGAGSAYISAAFGTVTSFAVTATSTNGDTYTIMRAANSMVVRTCTNAAGQTACVNGTW
jgi:Collagen triple helix repeat (20 copies)